MSEKDLFDNRLVFGDNLLALKALEAEFACKVKRVFIDPSNDTGSAFTQYDDGSLWITIDDNEAHYLKVLCDEVCGRQSFVANVVWQKAYTSNQTARRLSNTHAPVPSPLERARWGNWVIGRDCDAAMLAQAICKLEGFRDAPSEVHWWQHGASSERDFIWVTTQSLAVEQLQALAEPDAEEVPKAVLDRCEWRRDDYSLDVANLPMAQPDPPASLATPSDCAGARGRRAAPASQGELFDAEPA